jgi:hypothetical protein
LHTRDPISTTSQENSPLAPRYIPRIEQGLDVITVSLASFFFGILSVVCFGYLWLQYEGVTIYIHSKAPLEPENLGEFVSCNAWLFVMEHSKKNLLSTCPLLVIASLSEALLFIPSSVSSLFVLVAALIVGHGVNQRGLHTYCNC